MVDAVVVLHLGTEVKVRVIVGPDEFTLDPEAFLDAINGGRLVPGIWFDIAGGDAQRVQVARSVGTAVICRQNDQRMVEADLIVDECQQLGQCAVELQDVVLALEARRAKDVTDVVGR